MADPVITQWCPNCNELVQAILYLEYKRCMLIADKSVCPSCSRVLWDWRWGRGQIADKSDIPEPLRRKPEQMELF